MDTTKPHAIVCEWGGDHRDTGKPTCAICEIPKNLNEAIQRFLYYQAALEFGRKGSMAYRLRTVATRQYSNTIRLFRKYQAVSEVHPEWNLAQEILRLRTHFDGVTQDCSKEKSAFTRADPTVDHVLPQEFGHEEEALLNAINSVIYCYEVCSDSIEGHVDACLPPILETGDHSPRSDLGQIDDALRRVVDAIKLIPENENATARDLTDKAHKMCKEARRVLCEFTCEERPSRPGENQIKWQI